MTNDQAALIAAAAFCGPKRDGKVTDVLDIATRFLKWLEASE